MHPFAYKTGTLLLEEILQKDSKILQKVNYIPSEVDSSEGPAPVTSATTSGSGSLSCSDL